MEERLLADLFRSLRHVNGQLKASIECRGEDRKALLSGLSAPLRHVLQSLLVLTSIDRSGARDESTQGQQRCAVELCPRRVLDSVVDHLYQLLTSASATPSSDSSLPLADASPNPFNAFGPCASRSSAGEDDRASEKSSTSRLSSSTQCARDGADTSADVAVAPQEPVLATALWSPHVYGCEEAVAALQQALVLPYRFPHLFTGGRRAWRRLLLYGPPGTGKTHLVHVAAQMIGAELICLSGADLLSKWVGESEKQVRHVFNAASEYARCIVFLDELDALCGTRGSHNETEASRRLKTELLFQLQTLPASVTLLAATNLPWEIDGAVRRRFDRFVYVGLPCAATRRSLLWAHLDSVASDVSNEELDRLVEATALYSTSDLIHVIDHATLAPLESLLTNTALRVATEDEIVAASRTAHGAKPPYALGGDAESLTWAFFVPCATDDPRAVPRLTANGVASTQLLVPPVTHRHLEAALQAYPPSTTETDVQRIAQWGRQQG